MKSTSRFEFALGVLLLVAGCASSDRPTAGPFAPTYVPPTSLETPKLHLEPLHPDHTEYDYAALMSSREHLQRTLHWGSWPRVDFTLAENRDDLERHWKEFEAREAYAFTVLAADRARCVGCVYVQPISTKIRTPGEAVDENAARLSYWVIESELENDLDGALLQSVTQWLERAWTFSVVYLPLHSENVRGIAHARKLGFPETTALTMPDHVVFQVTAVAPPR